MPRERIERERVVEEYLRKQIQKAGGIAYKFTSPSRRSVPDRLCVLPGKAPFFVELKSTGKHPTPAQRREHDLLRRMGQTVYIVDHRDEVDVLMEVLNGES